MKIQSYLLQSFQSQTLLFGTPIVNGPNQQLVFHEFMQHLLPSLILLHFLLGATTHTLVSLSFRYSTFPTFKWTILHCQNIKHLNSKFKKIKSMDSTCVAFDTTLVCQDLGALLLFVNEMHGKLCMYIDYHVLNKIINPCPKSMIFFSI